MSNLKIEINIPSSVEPTYGFPAELNLSQGIGEDTVYIKSKSSIRVKVSDLIDALKRMSDIPTNIQGKEN